MLNKSKNYNENYSAKIVKLGASRKHEGADRLLCWNIDFQNVITNLEYNEGDVVIYFPLECAVNKSLISYIDGFQDKTLNKNIEIAGYFNKHARVRAVKLRGEHSQGFILPIDIINEWYKEISGSNIGVAITSECVGQEFDEINTTLICEKYIPKNLHVGTGNGKQIKRPKESKIIEGQFAFHFDTAQLVRNIHKIEPDTLISLSEKFHGTSVVIGNLLCKKSLNLWQKLGKKIGFDINDKQYDLLYSSRKVLKNSDLNPNANHYYKEDIWGIAAKNIYPKLNKGECLYAEIVGYTSENSFIQGPYDYSCSPGEHKLIVYRITQTNVDGNIIELSIPQMRKRCKMLEVEMMKELYYGYAKDKYPEILNSENWKEDFINKLKEEYLEQKCKYCKNDVWAEGIVLRIEGYEIENLKLKSFLFLEHESKQLDKEIISLEEEI